MLLVLVTQSPSSAKAQEALRLVSAACEQSKQAAVFFYQDGVHVANGFRWQSADQPNPQADWQVLAKRFGLRLPVCVGAALARGITDTTNAKRHGLYNPIDTDGGDNTTQGVPAHNLAAYFELVGLGELSELITQASQVITC